jgi:hypothetical protein
LHTLAKAEFQFPSGPRPRIGKIVITVPASDASVQNALAAPRSRVGSRTVRLAGSRLGGIAAGGAPPIIVL